MRNLLKVVILTAALAAAAFVLFQADLPGAWESLCRTTSASQRWLVCGLFLLPTAASYWLDTHGWIYSFGAARPRASFWRLFWIRLAGEALNQATPLMSLGGEPVKAMLLPEGDRAEAAGATSVMSAKFVMTLAQSAYVVWGIALALAAAPGHLPVLARFGLFPLMLGAVLVALLLLSFLLPARLRRAQADHPRLAKYRLGGSLVRQVLDFWRVNPRDFALAFVCFLAGWAVVAAEFWVVARVLGVPLTAREALALEALMNSVTMATFFIPGNVGSQEAGLLYLAGLYGLGTPFGAVMVVLRRAREVLWIGMGLGSLAVLGERSQLRAADSQSLEPAVGETN